MNRPSKLHLWFTTLTAILLILSLIPIIAAEDPPQSTLPPSHLLLGAGAKWAADEGTTALFVNTKDNWLAHHLTDGSNWPWFSESEMNDRRNLISQALIQSGLNVEFAGDMPNNLTNYDVIVIEANFAVEPKHSPIIRDYIFNGGGIVIIGSALCYINTYCKNWSTGVYNLDLIQEWMGCRNYVNAGGTGTISIDNPFGTQLQAGDALYRDSRFMSAGVSSLSDDAQAIAFWGSGPLFAYYRKFGQGRVYYQADYTRPSQEPISDDKPSSDNPSNMSPSHVLLGAGARWAAPNGTTALYVNFKDNWAAHHLTDGANWHWFKEVEMDNWRSSVTNALTQSGFEVTPAGDIPENLGDYDLVVIHAYYACEPRHAELIKNYVANGGGLVLIYGTPMYFVVECKDLWPGNLGGTNLASIQEWLGCGSYVDMGGTATPAFDNPLGTSFSKSDLIISTQGVSAAYSSLSADAEAIALWSSSSWSSGAVFAFTHEYGDGRVYCQGTLKIDYEASDSSPSPDSSGVSTSISISADVPSSFVGFAVDVYGVLSDDDGNAIWDEPVALFYTFPSYESWVPVTSDATNEFGEYNIRWIPPATGSFTLKAEWKGNATYSGSSDVLSLTTVPYEDDRVFSVESNSTVSAFAFNSTSLELRFSVSGLDGTTGYVKVTVAKSFVADVADVKVSLDERELAYSASSSGDSWLLIFTYGHSSHQIRIGLAANTATMSFTGILLWIAIGATPIAIAVIGLLVYFKKRKR